MNAIAETKQPPLRWTQRLRGGFWADSSASGAQTCQTNSTNHRCYKPILGWAHYFLFHRWLVGSLGSVVAARSALPRLQVKITLDFFAHHYHSASLAFKSCNCNSSIATRVGFSVWSSNLSFGKPLLNGQFDSSSSLH
jgi:hypothetical protein